MRNIENPLSYRLLEFKQAFIKDFKIYLRYPGWWLSELIQSPLWFIFFALAISLFTPASGGVKGAGMAYFFWGWFTLGYFSTVVWSIGHLIRREQLSGTLEQVLLTPSSRLAVFSAQCLRNLIIDSASIAYIAILFHYTAGIEITVANPLLLIMSFIAMYVMFISFGMIYASLVLTIKTPEALTDIIQFIIIILCGIFYPAKALPQPLLSMALLMPITYAHDLVKHAAMNTETLTEVSIELLAVYLLALLMLTAGLKLFKRIERVGKRKGSLGVY